MHWSPASARASCARPPAATNWAASLPKDTAPPPRRSRSVLDEVVELRRHFHRHPEVSFSEHETTRQLTERLRQLGLEIKPCPTETGVVPLLATGQPGQT